MIAGRPAPTRADAARSVRPLVVLAHGTRSRAGRAVIEQIVEEVVAGLPGTSARLGYVDVCEPGPAHALAGTRDAVVVPLFLTTGYHVRVDVSRAVVAHGAGTVSTPALTGHPGLRTALTDRSRQTVGGGRSQPDAAVLVAAGTSDPRAHAEVSDLARELSGDLGILVRAGYLTGLGPRPDEVIADLRRGGATTVTALSFLVAPGHFQTRLEALPADQHTAPLGTHPALIAALRQRYLDAAG